MQETWKPVKGFEHKYSISNLGRVKIHNYKRTGLPKLASTKPSRDGYCRVYFQVGYSKAFLVHRLVATHFVENDLPEVKIQVNHLDGDKSNNRADNLEWCNAATNIAHAFREGLNKNFGETHKAAKLTDLEIKVIIKMLGTGKISQRHLADIFNVSPMTISNIVNGKAWRHLND